MKNPCDKCHARRFCTRRCYAWKDYNRSRKEKEPEAQPKTIARKEQKAGDR